MTERTETGPYVGPRPFERKDGSLFFGREPESGELLSRVIAHQLVVFYAQSGAGKTSLLNARLAPRLEDRGLELLPARVGGERPGDIDAGAIPNPFSYGVLLSLVPQGMDPRDMLHESLAGFFKQREHTTDGDGRPLPRVLILDQFEELFTLYPDRWEQREDFFLQIRLAVREDPLLRVVLAVRDEYMPQAERYLRLIPEELRTRFRMERLRRSAALDAVTGPLSYTQRRFAEGVAETLVGDLLRPRATAKGTDEAPEEFVEPVHLQVVCQNLWRSLPTDADVITQEHVSDFGDVDQVLAEFYEDIIDKAAAETGTDEFSLRELCETELITPRQTRGTVLRDIESSGGVPNDAIEVLEGEHLIRAEWRAGAHWYELTHDRLIEPIRRSNEAARERRGRKAQARNRRLRRVIMTLLLVLAASLTSVVYTSVRNRVAQQAEETAREGRISRSLRFAARVPDALAADPQLGLLLAMESISVTYSVDSSYTVQAYAALWQALDSPPYVILRGHTASVSSACFDGQGKQILTASTDRTARLWDLAGMPQATLAGHTASVLRARFNSDGQYVLTASEDSTARLWTASGELVTEFSGHDGAVNDAVFSPSLEADAPGELVLTAGADGTARLWDIEANPIATLSGHNGPVNSAVFNRVGDLILTASADGTARLWRPDGTTIVTLIGHGASVNTAEFSPDGGLVLTASADGTARLWTLTGRNIATISGHTKAISHAAFSPDGERVVTASADGTARLWDLQGRPVVILAEHAGPVNYAAFSPDGRFVVSASADGNVRLWHRDGQALGTLSGRHAAALHAEFSPDGQLVVATKGGGAARLHYISLEHMMTLAQSRVTRTLTPEELQTYGGDTLLVPTPTPGPTATATRELGSPTVAPTPSPSAPPGMVLIPEGSFEMGSTQSQIDDAMRLCEQYASGDRYPCYRAAFEDEHPPRIVYLDEFFIDVHEVTNDRYIECVEAGVCSPPKESRSQTRDRYFGQPEYGDYPVTWVSWYDAQTYCEWAGKRLPTEAEWEKAARGTDGRIWPWGNDWAEDRLNCCGSAGDMTAVGSYPSGASPYGVQDMAGNAWEWVADCYEYLYYVSAPRVNPPGPSCVPDEQAEKPRALRGGSWSFSPRYARAADRSPNAPGNQYPNIGFRCAK